MIKQIAKFLIKHNANVPRVHLHDFMKWTTLRNVLRNLRINCVLDVGANIGQFASTLRAIGYTDYILSFEPLPDDFLILSQNFRGDTSWRGMKCALGESDCTMSFNYVVKNSFLSSFNKLKSNIDENVQIIPVQVKRLDSIYEKILENVEHPRIFLKMDTQGHDLEVINGSQGIINNILGIQSEVIVSSAFYENTTPHYENLSKYESLGFALMGMFEGSLCNKTRALLEYDCIMVKLSEYKNCRPRKK